MTAKITQNNQAGKINQTQTSKTKTLVNNGAARNAALFGNDTPKGEVGDFISLALSASVGAASKIDADNKIGEESSNKKSTRDGKISNTKQQMIGDCWLLSGINALSYTDKGKKILKNEVLEHHNDYTMVHLKGVGDYKITNEDVQEAQSQMAKTKSGKEVNVYTIGDDDITILELAMERAREDVANGEVVGKKINDISIIQNDSYAYDNLKTTNSTANGGFSTEAFYMITGNIPDEASNSEDKSKLLDKFNKKNYALAASLNDTVVIKDINGKKQTLAGNHAYAVKDVGVNTVTFTNPWDSGEEVVVKKDDFLNTFDRLYGCDLNKDAKSRDLTINTKEIVKQKDGKEIEIIKDKKGNILKKYTNDKDGNRLSGITYDRETHKIIQKDVYDKDGNRLTSTVLDKNTGKVKEQCTYNQNGELTNIKFYEYGKDGALQTIQENKNKFKDGKHVKTSVKVTDKSGNLLEKHKYNFTYDSDGKRETEASTVLKYEDGKQISKTKTLKKDTNNDGKLDTTTVKEYAGKKVNSEKTYVDKDNDGKCEKLIETDYKSNNSKTVKTWIGKKGSELWASLTNKEYENGKLQSKYTWTENFDGDSNWDASKGSDYEYYKNGKIKTEINSVDKDGDGYNESQTIIQRNKKGKIKSAIVYTDTNNDHMYDLTLDMTKEYKKAEKTGESAQGFADALNTVLENYKKKNKKKK